MKTQNITYLYILIFVALLVSGCTDKSRPTDLPKLYTCKIKVTQDGKPLEEATVTLLSKTPSKYGASSATTNATGVAVLRTYGYDGVPLGEYSVTITKTGVEGAKEAETPEGIHYHVGGKVYSYVDSKFSDDTKPPYEIKVTESGVNETFDAGAPVHMFLRNNE
ncbi:MAG: carboxypeptidase-like regulatory domain-containing protein [Planctomycetaceae bacterium]|jgi:hypothetical protein|nr:carboxypeptidase-like regulatory domain-containing protein [Planctomycetaceae bacterium]